MSSIDEIRDIRIKKLEALIKRGINPYPAKSQMDISLSEAFSTFNELEKSKENKWIAGRIMSIRGQGAIVFITLNDGTGTFQALLKKDVIGEEKLGFFSEVVDIGDFIEIYGTFFTTQRGEKTCEATDWRMLTKTLLPLPEKWHGFTNDDERYRKRYLDILMNDELRTLIEKRSAFWRHAREFMLNEGFLEIETPTLETTTGGAEARPFATHHNDFDIPVYLRISVGELWQKRALAAGFPKVFEIGRVYRNEGSSPEHLQEFTNMEFYAAYMDYTQGRIFVERMIKDVVMKTFNTLQFEVKGFTLDFSKPHWDAIEYVPYVKEHTGVDVLSATTEEMKAKLKELGVKYEGENRERLIDSLWKYCRKNIAGPVWLTNHPKIVSPLSKSIESNPELTERLQLILAGSEFSNSFSELNDPLDQRARFEEQKKLIERGDDEAMMPDWEFVEMLEHGMPPAFGTAPLGDRMFAVLAGYSIRETVLFPLMKPRSSTE
ncbi:MAG: lysine--tRNA ligase [Patescibacteria group bacterium]